MDIFAEFTIVHPVELLPEAIQQQVREGKIAARVAMKFLVPVARQTLEDCQRMAAFGTDRDGLRVTLTAIPELRYEISVRAGRKGIFEPSLP